MPDSSHTALRITLIFAAILRCHYNFKAALSITDSTLCLHSPYELFPPSLSLSFFLFSFLHFFFAIPFTVAFRFRPQSSGDFKAIFRSRRLAAFFRDTLSIRFRGEQPKPTWQRDFDEPLSERNLFAWERGTVETIGNLSPRKKNYFVRRGQFIWMWNCSREILFSKDATSQASSTARYHLGHLAFDPSFRSRHRQALLSLIVYCRVGNAGTTTTTTTTLTLLVSKLERWREAFL